MKDRNRNWVTRICVLLFCFVPELASAFGGTNYRLSLNTFYYTKKDETQTSGSTSNTNDVKTIYNDLLFGYVWENGFYLGALYASDSVETAVSTTTTVKEIINHYAASVGYSGQNWYFLGHYMLNGTYIPRDSAKWSKLSGWQLDVGYLFPITSSFNLGLQLAYRKLEYKEYETAGAIVSGSNYIRTEMIPMLGLTFLF